MLKVGLNLLTSRMLCVQMYFDFSYELCLNQCFVCFQCLKVVCQDMFFSRSKSSPTSMSVIGQPTANSRPALEQALAPLAKKADDRTNVIGELVDMKVDGPIRTEFSPQVRIVCN